jgi:hypothetical protein
VPLQIVAPEPDEILTEGTTVVFTVIVIILEVTIAGEAHRAEEVIVTETS